MDKAIPQLSIAYRHSRRARNLRITIHPTQAVTVTVPINTSLERVKEFVCSKQVWLKKHLGRMQERDNLQPPQPQLSREELVKAQDDLFSRLERFSKTHNLPYRRAAFRCQKTKWGSCSSQNHISLNINIVFLPTHLQNYILLHELCHIRHKNHSQHFWKQLNEYCGGRAKKFVTELKTHKMKLRR